MMALKEGMASFLPGATWEHTCHIVPEHFEWITHFPTCISVSVTDVLCFPRLTNCYHFINGNAGIFNNSPYNIKVIWSPMLFHFSLLVVEAADRPGLLVDLVKAISDTGYQHNCPIWRVWYWGETSCMKSLLMQGTINLLTYSIFQGLLAKAKFHVSYRGRALSKTLQQVKITIPILLARESDSQQTHASTEF